MPLVPFDAPRPNPFNKQIGQINHGGDAVPLRGNTDSSLIPETRLLPSPANINPSRIRALQGGTGDTTPNISSPQERSLPATACGPFSRAKQVEQTLPLLPLEGEASQPEQNTTKPNSLEKALDIVNSKGDQQQREDVAGIVAQTSRYHGQLEDFRKGIRTTEQDSHHPPEKLQEAISEGRKQIAEILLEIRRGKRQPLVDVAEMDRNAQQLDAFVKEARARARAVESTLHDPEKVEKLEPPNQPQPAQLEPKQNQVSPIQDENSVILYKGGNVTILEVTAKSYFPETLALDEGIKLAMYHVDGENGRLIDQAAVVDRGVERTELTASQQEKAFSIFHALYPTFSLEDFIQSLQYHQVTFLYPHEGNLNDIDLTFGIAQRGRLNGLAVNLAQDDSTDQEAIIGLKSDGVTNVPLGVGTGRYKGLFLYDNPEIQFDKDGNQMIDSHKAPPEPEALLFIVPGRVTKKPVELTTLPDFLQEQIGEWEGVVERENKIIYLNELTPPHLETDEAPPTPHIVRARWGAVNCLRSGLANEALRTQIAQKI